MGMNNQDELEAAFGHVNKGLRYTEPASLEDYQESRPSVNTTRKALELLEPCLATERYWARVTTMDGHTFFEAGPLHDNGFEECPTFSGTVYGDGRVFESHRRI